MADLLTSREELRLQDLARAYEAARAVHGHAPPEDLAEAGRDLDRAEHALSLALMRRRAPFHYARRQYTVDATTGELFRASSELEGVLAESRNEAAMRRARELATDSRTGHPG